MDNRAIIAALAALALLALTGEAEAQCTGQPPANRVCAGPASGGPGLPTFRVLTTADVPAVAGGVTSFGPVGSPRTGVVNPASGDYSFSLISGQITLAQFPALSGNDILLGSKGSTAVGEVPLLNCASGNTLNYSTATHTFSCNAIPPGGVTTFSAGNLSPLFTTSVATPTTTPALSFSLSNAAQNAVFAGPTSGTGAPTFRALVSADLPAGVPALIAAGTAALGTGAIGTASCATAVTGTATSGNAANILATDTLQASFNSDPTGVVGYQPLATGMLVIIHYPSAGAANFKVCNNTAATITPGAITLNWRVMR